MATVSDRPKDRPRAATERSQTVGRPVEGRKGRTRMQRKIRAKRPAKKAGADVTKIPPEQWDMPVSFAQDGSMVSLREFIHPTVPVLSLSQLSPEQRAELTVKRIELQPRFELGMIGAGIVDKSRAIAEVKSQSKVGRLLTEIEQRVINNLVTDAARKP